MYLSRNSLKFLGLSFGTATLTCCTVFTRLGGFGAGLAMDLFTGAPAKATVAKAPAARLLIQDS